MQTHRVNTHVMQTHRVHCFTDQHHNKIKLSDIMFAKNKCTQVIMVAKAKRGCHAYNWDYCRRLATGIRAHVPS